MNLNCALLASILLCSQIATAQNLTASDQKRFYFEARVLAEISNKCEAIEPETSAVNRAALDRMRTRHAALLAAVERQLREELSAESLKRLEERLRAMTEDELEEVPQRRSAFCRELAERLDELAKLDAAGVAMQNFSSELLHVEHRQGMKCDEVEGNLRRVAAEVLAREPRGDANALQAPLADVFVISKLERVHSAAQGCTHAQALASARQIPFPGNFIRLALLAHQLLQTEHPLMLLGRSDRAQVIQAARESAASFLAEGKLK